LLTKVTKAVTKARIAEGDLFTGDVSIDRYSRSGLNLSDDDDVDDGVSWHSNSAGGVGGNVDSGVGDDDGGTGGVDYVYGGVGGVAYSDAGVDRVNDIDGGV